MALKDDLEGGVQDGSQVSDLGFKGSQGGNIPYEKNRLSMIGGKYNYLVINFYEIPNCLVAELFPTLCNPMDYSLPGIPHPWDFPGKNAGLPFPSPEIPNRHLNRRICWPVEWFGPESYIQDHFMEVVCESMGLSLRNSR